MLDRERKDLIRQYAGEVLAAIVSTSVGTEALPEPDQAAQKACELASALVQEVEKAETKLEQR